MYSELCVQKLVEHRGKKITNEVMNKQLFKTHFVCCYLKMAITFLHDPLSIFFASIFCALYIGTF